MIRIFVFTLAVLAGFSRLSAAEENYTCSYPAYLGKEPVIVKIKVDGANAIVDDYKYRVLANSKLGVVLTRAFAEHNPHTKQDDLGAFVFVIDKRSMKMVRGNVISGEMSGSPVTGKCVQ